jgi:hypothetical protein
MRTILKISVLSLGSISLPVLAGGDSSLITLSLRNTGVDADAAGIVEINLKEQSSAMRLTLAKLTPGVAYTVTNGATPEAGFIADAKGGARLNFATKPKKGSFLLDFEPRGQVLSVRTEDGVDVLQAVVSGEGEPAKSSVSEYVEITTPGSKGKATARFLVQPTGHQAFSIQLSQITGTGWSLYVDGVWRGEFMRNGSGARIDFDTTPQYASTRLLDFDPRGRMLDIVQAKNIVFSGTMAAQAAEVNVATYEWWNGAIPSTALDSDGSARVKLLVESDARRKFLLWLMDVPEGGYEFIVNGTLAATIQAVATDDGVVGAVEFSSRNDDSDELPLTFDPAGAIYTIQKGGLVYFTGRLAIESGGKGTDEDLNSIKEDLVSTGYDSNAKGHATFKIDKHGHAEFIVDIRKTPLGTFKLWAGGIERGSFTTKFTETESKDDGYNGYYGYNGYNGYSNSGDKREVFGSITFKTGSKKRPLDFDPRGLLIEVGNSSRIYFSQIFGGGRGTALPVISRLPLFSAAGLPNAIAKMEFKRDEQGVQSFEVGIEDAPPGNYELFVGENQRATIEVADTNAGSRGLIEFDDMPHSGQALLDFDPRGETISVAQGGVVCFQRALPAGL